MVETPKQVQYTEKVVTHQQTYQYLACHHVSTQPDHYYRPQALFQGNATPRNSLQYTQWYGIVGFNVPLNTV